MKKKPKNGGIRFPLIQNDLKLKITTLFLLVTIFNIQANTYTHKTKVDLGLNNTTVKTVLVEKRNAIVDVKQIIKGKVTDENGMPLPGASIMEEKTKKSVSTDFDGNFEIAVDNSEAVLIITYIGYKQKRVVANKDNITIQLSPDTEELKQVIVVGYGSVKKKDATGAVDQISSKKFDNVAATSPAEILRGKVAGVQITTSSGEPGASTAIRIRGNTSLRSGNGPLIVVDGVPLDGSDSSAGGADTGLGTSSAKSPLNFINQNDIESMSVLKDASSTAIYGSRGANGVIIITTKKSKTKEPQLNLNTSVGISSYSSKFDIMSREQYLAAGGTDKGGSYNWKDALLQTGITKNYDLSYATGGENSSTRISFGANNTEGIVKNTGMDKYTFSLSNSTDFIGGAIKIEPKILYSAIKDKTTLLSENVGYIGNAIASSLYWNPTLPIYNSNGSYNVVSNDYLNPVQLNNSYKDFTNTSKLLASINTTVKLSSNLKYQFLLAFENSNSVRKSQLLPSMLVKDAAQASFNSVTYYGQADINNLYKFNRTFEHTLSYNKEFNPNVILDVIAGFSYYDYNFDSNSSTGKGFNPNQTNLIDDIQGSVGWLSGKFGPVSRRNKVELQSYFGRATANLYEKFIVNATLRRDGSSKLGANNKYDNFYSVGAAYKVVEGKEGFVNDLKLRGSYGLTGNQEFAPNSAIAYSNYISPSTLGNLVSPSPDLKWETTLSSGIGVDFTLLNNRLTGSVDYFAKDTKNLIFAKAAESTQVAPAALKYVNLPGFLQSKGFEVALGYKIIDSQDLSWDVNANASFLTNKLVDFPLFVPVAELNGQGLSGAYAEALSDGVAAYSYYMYEFKGYNEAGASIYTDAKGDSVPLGSAVPHLLDKQPLPKINVGFNTSFSYKKIDAGVSFYGAFRHYIYNNTNNALFFKGAFPIRNITSDVANSVQNSSDPNSPSTKYLEKGDFIRMGNLTLGYTFSGALLEKAKIKSARLFLNGQNLLLFTNYSGFDPEVNTNKILNGVPSAGIDYLAYPKSKTISVGLNVNF
jgi:TonB-dependent starch-binding outer membrane protein SusC